MVDPYLATSTEVIEGLAKMLYALGEDPKRDGLRDTPKRMFKALCELTDGYDADVGAILDKHFDIAYDEMVVVKGVRFASLCEHHILPFVGVATVGYIPGERVVGLSKLARLVGAYAHRLQVQERMTTDIANAVEEHLKPVGTGVVLRATHMCMAIRGVRQEDATMTTSALYGALRENPAARAEFLALAREAT